jgi:hypothetical protein
MPINYEGDNGKQYVAIFAAVGDAHVSENWVARLYVFALP